MDEDGTVPPIILGNLHMAESKVDVSGMVVEPSIATYSNKNQLFSHLPSELYHGFNQAKPMISRQHKFHVGDLIICPRVRQHKSADVFNALP